MMRRNKRLRKRLHRQRKINKEQRAAHMKLQVAVTKAAAINRVPENLADSLDKLKHNTRASSVTEGELLTLTKLSATKYLVVNDFNDKLYGSYAGQSFYIKVPHGKFPMRATDPETISLPVAISLAFEQSGVMLQASYSGNLQKILFSVKDSELETIPPVCELKGGADPLLPCLGHASEVKLSNEPILASISKISELKAAIKFSTELELDRVYNSSLRGKQVSISLPDSVEGIALKNIIIPPENNGGGVMIISNDDFASVIGTPELGQEISIAIHSHHLRPAQPSDPISFLNFTVGNGQGEIPLEKEIPYHKVGAAIYKNYFENTLSNYYAVQLYNAHRVKTEDDGRIKLRLEILYRSAETIIEPLGADRIENAAAVWGVDFRYGWLSIDHITETVTFAFDLGPKPRYDLPPLSSPKKMAPGFRTESDAAVADTTGTAIYSTFTKTPVAKLPWLSIINKAFWHWWSYKYGIKKSFEKFLEIQVVRWSGDPSTEACTVKLRMVVQYLDLDLWDCHPSLIFPTDADLAHCKETRAAAIRTKHLLMKFNFGPNWDGFPDTAHFDSESVDIYEPLADINNEWEETAICVYQWDIDNLIDPPSAASSDIS